MDADHSRMNESEPKHIAYSGLEESEKAAAV
jgi:hypothetical protein